MFQVFQDIQGIIQTYRSQMLILAHQYDRATWIAQFNHDPYAQLDADLARLNGLVEGLKSAVEQNGAQSLLEACELLCCSGDAQVVSTLEYVLSSEYEGFRKMREKLVD